MATPMTTTQGSQHILRERWIEALESGELTQGVNALKTADGYYCCLGVAAEKVLKREFYKDLEDSGTMVYNDGQTSVDCISYLSPYDSRILGLDAEPTKEQLQEVERMLGIVLDQTITSWENLFAILNDEFGFPFKDIAKVVRYLND